MALQLPQTLLSQVANFGQQPMQNLQQGLLTPVQVAAQQPAGVGALVSGLGGMFGVDTRSPQQLAQAEAAKLKEAQQRAALEASGQQASQSAYALRQAADLGDTGRKLIRQRDLGLISDAQLLEQVSQINQSRLSKDQNKGLFEYERMLRQGQTDQARQKADELIAMGVSVDDLDKRRTSAETAISKTGAVVPKSLTDGLSQMAASGDSVAQAYLEAVSSDKATSTTVNSALSYFKDQTKTGLDEVPYLQGVDFTNQTAIQKARQTALMNNDVGVAQQLGTMADELAAKQVNLNAKDVIDIASAVNPEYPVLKKNQLSLKTAVELLAQDPGAGSVELIERSITDIARSDAKSLEAMKRFSRSKAIDQRVADSLSMFISGELTNATIQDYRNIATSLLDFYTRELEGTALQLLGSGNAEDQAAGSALLQLSTGGVTFIE